MTLPTWVTHETRGKPVTGNSRTARVSTCTPCQAPTIVGLDVDHGGFATTCDPTPLTQLGEVLAILAGRRTLTLRRRAGRLELDRRDDLRISWEPAEAGPWDVLAVHTCHAAPLPSTTSTITPATTDGWGLPEDPPF